MAPFQEDPLLQIAINESVQVAPKRSKFPSGESASSGSDEEADVKEPRVTIDDRIGELASGFTIELPDLSEADADTWVFIDPTAKQPEQDDEIYKMYVKHCSKPIPMKRTTLLKLNSPTINNAFGPTAQFRLLRRRQLVDKLPGGISYVIDLTPPSEGEDAVWLISSLSCSEGVRTWYQSEQALGVSSQLVAGEEDYLPKRPNPKRGSRASRAAGQVDTRPTKVVLEYSPTRTRAAFERLLAIAIGADPKINSAPKLWTTFAAARHLGVAHSPLTDYIVTWLRAYPNSMFLEVHMETSHIMADQLEVYDLERDTFAMLVGEEALDSIVRSREPGKERMSSTFGRKKEDLPEHIQTRVEYASKIFSERITADFEQLKRGKWIESLDEFKRLSSFTHPDLQTHITTLKVKLMQWIQGAICHVQCSKYEKIPNPHHPPLDGSSYMMLYEERKDVFQSLQPAERILTRTFWNALESLNLFGGATNLHVNSEWNQTAVLPPQHTDPIMASDGYRKIARRALTAIVDTGQAILNRMDVPDLQTMAISDTKDQSILNPSAPTFVPLEAANRFSLPTRTVPAAVQKDLVTTDDRFAEQRATLRGPLRDTRLPAPQVLPGISSRDNWSGTSEKWTMEPNVLTPDESPSSRASIDVVDPYRDLKLEKDEEDSLASWGESLAVWSESLQTYQVQGKDVRGSSDTAPLLSQGHERSNGRNRRLDLSQIYRSQGTKRTSEITQPESDIWENGPQRDLNFLFPKRAKVHNPPEFFNLPRFFAQAEQHINLVTGLKLSYTDKLNGRVEPHSIELLNTLVCLDEPEFKYLPLWAGGCDDGSGGVFDDEVAMPDVSFATAGPSIHHGAAMHTVSECDTVSENGAQPAESILTPTSSMSTSSDYNLVNRDGASTVYGPASDQTTAGYFTDRLQSDQVYAADSIDGSSETGGVRVDDDAFSVVARSEGLDPDDEEARARREIEALELAEAIETAAVAEAARLAAQARLDPVNDENYADLFGSEDGDDIDDDDNDDDDDGNASDDTMQGLDDDDDGKETSGNNSNENDKDNDCEGEGELI